MQQFTNFGEAKILVPFVTGHNPHYDAYFITQTGLERFVDNATWKRIPLISPITAIELSMIGL